MPRSKQEQYVTTVLFKRETTSLKQDIKNLHEKIDSSVERLDKKIDNIAIRLVHTEEDVKEIKRTMSTKDDINMIMDRLDYFAKGFDDYRKKAIIQDYRFNQIEPKLEDHEKRLTALEPK